jgi:hypothetical protein
VIALDAQPVALEGLGERVPGLYDLLASL